MARKALHQKGNLTELVTVHSLCSPVTWILILFTGGHASTILDSEPKSYNQIDLIDLVW